MGVVSFSLSPASTGRIYDLLLCLAKFGDAVSIEAGSDKLSFTTLNLSRTAHASFTLDAKSFFLNYSFNGDDNKKASNQFTCQLLNKALQSVFKGRTNDFRGRETVVERCDVHVQDQPDKTQCRLVVKMLCKHGLTKTYRLTYEAAEVMHALFDRNAASQGWKISSRVMREYVEFFGPKTEQLDIVATDDKAIFRSFTEKIQDGQEVLKQPFETAISIHKDDFDDFHMQEDMHVVISVKDFKAIVTHAETVKGKILARFSHPSRPLQICYEKFGILSEFTLTTMPDFRSSQPTDAPKFVSNRPVSEQSLAVVAPPASWSASEMPPPARPNMNKPLGSQNHIKVARGPTPQSFTSEPGLDTEEESQSLFVPVDDDRTWDAANYESADEEEMLGWDASIENASASFRPTFRDSNTVATRHHNPPDPATKSQDGLEPTQRLSQLHGMFD